MGGLFVLVTIPTGNSKLYYKKKDNDCCRAPLPEQSPA